MESKTLRMAGIGKEKNHTIELVEKDRKEKECDDVDDTHDSGDAYNNWKQPNSNFLREMNLLIMVLSVVSLSSEGCINSADSGIKSTKDDEAKGSILRINTRRRDIHDVRPFGRRSQRFQPTIKDCRHGRKM